MWEHVKGRQRIGEEAMCVCGVGGGIKLVFTHTQFYHSVTWFSSNLHGQYFHAAWRIPQLTRVPQGYLRAGSNKQNMDASIFC